MDNIKNEGKVREKHLIKEIKGFNKENLIYVL